MSSKTLIAGRIQNIDILRGLVMVIMALDHTRDFTHHDMMIGNDPLDFSTTSPFLFLTRWITHFCAPIFVLLAGLSIGISSERKSKNELGLFLLTRGLWLCILELTIVSLGWSFSLQFGFLMLQVIWAIGMSMVFISGLIFLPKILMKLIGILLVFGHNFFDNLEFSSPIPKFIWGILHVPEAFNIPPGIIIFTGYPLLPWLGLMILGVWIAELYEKAVDSSERKKWLIGIGIACLALFVLLRSGNFYGDAEHWSPQKNTVFSILSFINTTKYPPSLLYLLMTCGPALIFLGLTEKIKFWTPGFFLVFGKVPLFYYILHIYLIHGIAILLLYSSGMSLDPDAENFIGFPTDYGYSLRFVYLIWLAVPAILYFPCLLYSRYKSSHKHWLLSYL